MMELSDDIIDNDSELAKQLQEEEDRLYNQHLRMKNLVRADQELAEQLQKDFSYQMMNSDKKLVENIYQEQLIITSSSNNNNNTSKSIIIQDNYNNSVSPSTSSIMDSSHYFINEDSETEYDPDLLLALRLQEEENKKAKGKGKEKVITNSPSHSSSTSTTNALIYPSITSVGDEYDPNPDLIELFLAFNDMYFDGKLGMVEVKWSTKMKVCAGLCRYQSGGYCTICLSEPLLKFRPRSDMVNTLLHEMIHALLFVTRRFDNHESHGPEFLREADRINRHAGTNITIYHNFNDEVNHYKTHVWRCDGPCQHQPPYFGYVKRSMNRPPQKADSWFARHQKKCGGTFIKIKSPPAKPKTTKKLSEKSPKDKKSNEQSNKMTNYLIDDDDNYQNCNTLITSKATHR
ncbi:SprT-like family-domain-containing protein [Cunninghamella echinulata]|nr:SprT-like family-domain-containing protein [Cunninghamella echinulata]